MVADMPRAPSPGKSYNDEQRLELLHDWLDGNDDAGNELWLDAGFFEECRAMGIRSAQKKIRSRRGNKQIGEDIGSAEDDIGAGSLVTGWLWDILQHEVRSGKDPKDFQTLQDFRKYMARVLAGRVNDLLEKEYGADFSVRGVRVESGDAEGKDSPSRWEATESPDPTPEERTLKDESGPALELICAFRPVLTDSRAEFLDTVVEFFSGAEVESTTELKDNDVARRVIEEYLNEDAHYHHVEGLSDHVKKRGFSQPSVYKGRLRDDWIQFRDGEGLDLWIAYSRHRFDMHADFSPYVTSEVERPLLGRIDFGLQNLDRLAEELWDEVKALQSEGGGVLAVPHSDQQEPSVNLLLQLLAYRLRSNGTEGSVRLSRPYLEPHRLEATLSAEVCIIPHLPRMSGTLTHIESGDANGQVVVGAGLEEEWQRTSIEANHRVFDRLPEASDLTEWRRRVVKEEASRYVELSGTLQRIYRTAAVWDARGVPLRFDVLARTLDLDPGDARRSVNELVDADLLYWVHDWRDEDRRVATKSPVVAREIIDQLAQQYETGTDVRLDCFHDVLKALDPERKSERYLALQLYQSASPNHSFWQHAVPTGSSQPGQAWANALIRNDNWPLVESLFDEMDPEEAVLWGRTLSRLRLFDKAEAVLESAMRRHGRNPPLLHAHAQTLADQVQVNASRAPEAEKAFESAIDQAPGNCYLYQSLAVTLAKVGKDPTVPFERALSAAGSSGERAAVRVAWADSKIERNNYAKAEDHLNEAEREVPSNAYVPHVRGKIAFLNGRYADAEAYFHEVIEQNLHNVVAWNALGHMARVRRHWEGAEEWLNRALEFDPENVPTLHERGNLLVDIAEAEEREANGGVWPAEETRRSAIADYEKALNLEPDNVKVLVSLANALLPFAANEAGDDRKIFKRKLDKALDLVPGSVHALQVYGRFHQAAARYADTPTRAEEKRQKARDHFERALANEDLNLPTLCSLAELHVDTRDEGAARDTLDDLERALDASSPPAHEHVRTLNKWAQIEERLGNADRAVELVEEALGMDNENEYTLRLLQRLRGTDDRGE